MSQRKVLIVVHQLNLGGVQRALISALNAIDYSQNEVTLYIRKDRTDLLDQVNKNVSRIIINKDKTKYYRKPYAVWLQLLQKIKHSEKRQQQLNHYIIESQMKYEKQHFFSDNIEYDISISHVSGITCKFVAEYINAKRKICFHFGSTIDCPEIYDEAFLSYDIIVSDSNGSAAVLKKAYPQLSHRILVINNYVDSNEIIAKAYSERIDIPSDRLILCSCGRFTNVKGFDLAVEAAKILKDNQISYLWLFVGDGSEREHIDSLINKYNLYGYIRITGLQSNPYLYINCCDIYVQPSREESYCLTITEAKILKKVIVSTCTVGALEQIIDGENGFITDINASELASRIIKCVQNKKQMEHIKTNIDMIDWGKEKTRYIRDWKKLLEG